MTGAALTPTERAARDDAVARRFHEVYEALAPSFGYETRTESAVPWADVPEQNKALMRTVVSVLIEEGTVDCSVETEPISPTEQPREVSRERLSREAAGPPSASLGPETAPRSEARRG